MSNDAPRTQVDGPLDAVNDAFHAAYDHARTGAVNEAPVLVLLGDALLRLQRGERAEFALTPRVFHVLKSAAHAPLALFVLLYEQGERPLDQSARARLTAMRARLADALRSAGADVDDEAALATLRAILEKTAGGLESALDGTPERGDFLSAFAGEMGPLLLELTRHATRIELAALEACVDRALEGLPRRELDALQVVVAGAHQARERSLGMQYFRKRLGEASGHDERVTYAENVTSEQEALALIGTRRLDRAIAAAFFGDPRRLQRDVLGDAAAALLEASAGLRSGAPPR